MATLLAALAATLAALAIVATAVAWCYPPHAWLALRRAPRGSRSHRPLSVLVPLRGAPPGLAADLDRVLGQELPAGSEVLFCVEYLADPAAAVVRGLLATHRAVAARLVESGPPGEALAKVHNLGAGLARARGGVIVLLDADAHLPHPRFLVELAAPLDDAATGVVTAFPWYVGARDVPAALLGAMIDTDLLGTFSLRAAYGSLRFANGTCMALRRDALAATRGLAWLGRRMLMDSALAAHVAATGRRVMLHHEPVLVRRERATFRAVWTQAMRWHVCLRHGLLPGRYAAFGLLRAPLVLALLAWAAAPQSRMAPLLVLGVAASRTAVAWLLACAAGTARRSAASILAQPLADLVNPVAWVAGLARSTMEWHGRRYRVSRSATIEPLPALDAPSVAALRRALDVLRVHDWSVQLPLVAFVAMAVATARPLTSALAASVAWACGVQALLLCGGYLLNDLADRDADARAGRTRASRLTPAARGALVVALLACGVVLASRGGTAALVLVLVQVGAGAAYSLRPVRLKERGVLGVAAAALLQRVPGVALIWTQLAPDPVAAACGIAWLVALGVAFIVEHQLEDLAADRAAGVTTWTTGAGAAVARRLRDDARFAAGVAAIAAAAALARTAMPGIAAAVAWPLADAAAFAAMRGRYRADRRAPRLLHARAPAPEVRIHGGGLAGLVAATRLARWGVRVVVLEQRTAIGGMAQSAPAVHSARLDPRALARALDLTIADRFEPVARECVHWEGHRVDVPPRHVQCVRGATVDALEHRLFALARAAGARIEFGVPLRIGERPAPGPCIVATGLARAGALVLGIDTEPVHGWVASEPWAGAPELHTFRRRAFGAGYGYVASSRGVRSALLFTRGAAAPGAREVFARDVEAALGWRPRFVSLHGAVPLRPRLARRGVLLAGTLAGMIDPFYLGGIEAALVSGTIAAHAVLDRDAAERAFARATAGFALHRTLAALAWSPRTPPGVAFGATLVGSSLGRVGSLRAVS